MSSVAVVTGTLRVNKHSLMPCFNYSSFQEQGFTFVFIQIIPWETTSFKSYPGRQLHSNHTLGDNFIQIIPWETTVFVFVFYALLCVLSSFSIILKRKRELVTLLLLSYGCLVSKCSVALSRSAMGWSTVCDCGIS